MKSPPIPNKRKTFVNSENFEIFERCVKRKKWAAFLGYFIYDSYNMRQNMTHSYLFEFGIFLYSSNRKASFIITPIHQCRINSISSWIHDKIKIAALRRDLFQEISSLGKFLKKLLRWRNPWEPKAMKIKWEIQHEIIWLQPDWCKTPKPL